MNKKVKHIINSIYSISENSFQKIDKLLQYKTVKKGEIFIQKNLQYKNEYFLLNGICKSYLMNPNGEEITISFYVENSILSPHQTRTAKDVSVLNFKALIDIELALINVKDFENLMIENLDIRNFANTVLQNKLMAKVEKEIGLASFTVKERLLKFREKFKILENLIPHTDIASYLGITNVSLSRIRKEYNQ